MLYPTAEHYLMAEKARIFGDEKARAAIIKATHPNEAKRLGREIAAFDESVWQQVRTDIVVRGNLLKFTQHPTLATFLTQTGSRILVKASPLNSIWGIGLSQDHPQAAHPAEWSGLNLSGFALMRVRQLLA